MKQFSKLYFMVLLFCQSTAAQEKTDPWLKDLFMKKASPFLQKVLMQADTFQYQVIYTKIDRDRKNKPRFTHYYLNVDRNRYFNPASTVKLPTVLAALEKLNQPGMDRVDKYTALVIDSAYEKQTRVETDSSSATGLPSIAHYIHKIFLTSDNDAYNRLYEFVGQQPLNESLHKKGYGDLRITRRFVSMNEVQNRHTNPFRFMRDGKVIYSQPPAFSRFQFDYTRKILVGLGHWDRNDSLVQSPMDFTTHNNLPLEDLHTILRSILFPESLAAEKRFRITGDDREFLLRTMGMLPSQSQNPRYDTAEFFDSYTKFFFKAGKQRIPPHIRILNKTGWSYGFLTDAAYVIDLDKKIEFMLSAVIYVNADGILNDNRYEYEKTGYPFFNEIFRIIYEYELQRKRRHQPNLDEFSGTVK